MSTISSAQDLLNASAVGTAEAKKPPSGTLGKDDFLKLLTGQLKNQDPMKPMEDKDFMGQLAQFSQLEQTTNLAKSMQNQQAFSLIGRAVTYNDKDTGELKSGTVQKVAIQSGKTTLTIGGVDGIAPDTVTEVS